MLLSKSDVLFAFGTLQSSFPAGHKDTGVEVSNKRAASVSTACLLGLTACKALQSLSWISRGFGALLLIELGFYLYQRNRYHLSLWKHLRHAASARARSDTTLCW